MTDREYTPISDRVRGRLDREEVRELIAMERMLSAGVTSVAANGRFPHWPIDRWISILGFSGVFLWQVFSAGARWTGVQRDIREVKDSVTMLQATVDVNRQETAGDIRDLAGEVRQMRDEHALAIDALKSNPPARTPVFPRDEQFSGRER